jgi:hypothetical protein
MPIPQLPPHPLRARFTPAARALVEQRRLGTPHGYCDKHGRRLVLEGLKIGDLLHLHVFGTRFVVGKVTSLNPFQVGAP